MTRLLLTAVALATLLAAVPGANAYCVDEDCSGNPPCPEDQPCLMSAPPESADNETAPDGTVDNATGEPRPDDGPSFEYCGDEVCAYDCIECTGAPTCMDGSAKDCDPDLQYLDGRGPADCENCRGEDLETTGDAKDKDANGFVGFLGIVALVGALFVARRK